MIIASAKYELHVPTAGSLKEKRQVLKSLMGRLRHRYNVAVAEVDGHDTWQRAVVGVACVSSSQSHARELIDTVTRHVEGCIELELTRVNVDFHSQAD